MLPVYLISTLSELPTLHTQLVIITAKEYRGGYIQPVVGKKWLVATIRLTFFQRSGDSSWSLNQ